MPLVTVNDTEGLFPHSRARLWTVSLMQAEATLHKTSLRLGNNTSVGSHPIKKNKKKKDIRKWIAVSGCSERLRIMSNDR